MKVKIDKDNYWVVQFIKKELGVPEKKALNILIEVGFINLLINQLPPEEKLQKQNSIDAFLAKPEIQKLSEDLRYVWV